MTCPFDPFDRKMRGAGQPELAVATFRHYFDRLRAGETGLVEEASVEPVLDLPDAEQLPSPSDAGREALGRAVVIKLNGGLGTSMGMTGAKSLVTARDGLSFLDVVARQVLALRRRHGVRLPLLLMNSFRTRAGTLEALAAYDGLAVAGLPLDFLQHMVPKVRALDLSPATWPDDPELEWCPPGHGDIYTALVTSGMLDRLVAAGFEYALVSNSDNLGATLDPSILAWFASNGLPFLMEVSDRTEADRKGGHLARYRSGDRLVLGRLVLRESAQCAASDEASFQDHRRHRYFNTNTLWLHLPALRRALDESGGILDLPMIRNRKHLDPNDDASPEVYQLETAMGTAISVFEGAAAIRVPRTRFAPVKTTGDLLLLWSDRYSLSEDFRLEPAPGAAGPHPRVDLDPDYFRTVAMVVERFPAGPPSLLRCDRLIVKGDVRFGAGVCVQGDVRLQADPGTTLEIPDGAVVGGP